jgi:hypothetical protein
LQDLNTWQKQDAVLFVLNLCAIQEMPAESYPTTVSQLLQPRLTYWSCSIAFMPANLTYPGLILKRSVCCQKLMRPSGSNNIDPYVSLMSASRFSPKWLLVGSTRLLTMSYGPCEDDAKLAFLAELASISSRITAPWLLIGDFNLIYDARDKHNGNLNHRLMSRFRSALNDSELKEIKLVGRCFTWSNEQCPPTLVRLDRAFCDAAWDMRFSHARLLLMATTMSDHCPLILTYEPTPCSPLKFRFKAFWVHLEGFSDVVTKAWMDR